MKQKHTPVPWDLSGHDVITKDNGRCAIATTDIGMVATIEERTANATFIIHAVNLHYDMLKVLKSFPDIDCDTEDVLKWIQKQEKIISKADKMV